MSKHKGVSLNHWNNSRDSIKYSNDTQYLYENIEEYNPDRKCTVLVDFDDTIGELQQITFKQLKHLV